MAQANPMVERTSECLGAKFEQSVAAQLRRWLSVPALRSSLLHTDRAKDFELLLESKVGRG